MSVENNYQIRVTAFNFIFSNDVKLMLAINERIII